MFYEKLAELKKEAVITYGGGGVTLGHEKSPLSLYTGHRNMLGVLPFPDAGIRVGSDDMGLTVGLTNIGIDQGAMGRGSNVYNSGLYGDTKKEELFSAPNNDRALRLRDSLIGAGLLGSLAYSQSKGDPARLPISLVASGVGAASGLGLGLGLRGKKREKQEKRATFYEKLAEAQDEKKRLSAKQKLGLGLALTAGGAGGAFGGDQLSKSKTRFGDYLRLAADEAEEQRRYVRATRDLDDRAARALEELTSGRRDNDMGSVLADTLQFHADYEQNKRLNETNKLRIINDAKIRRRLAMGGLGLAGAGATAYGAKKLFDRYNHRKQRKD